jgi:hypothetical protein
MAESAGLAVVAGLEGVARMKEKDPETFHRWCLGRLISITLLHPL